MNGVLFRHGLRSNAWRLLAVSAALVAWGTLLPIVFATFGEEFRTLVDLGLIPQQLLEFLGGNVLTLPAAIALGAVHPIAVFLEALLPVAIALAAVAGERQRGTLEVLLSRPVDRRDLHATVLLVVAVVVSIAAAAEIAGSVAGAAAYGLLPELPVERLPFLWLNGALLYLAIGAIALAASVSFDRLAPAVSVTLAVLVVAYVLDALARLWPDARGLGPWSLFHYFDPLAILRGSARPSDLGVLGIVALAAFAYGRWRFPRRDLAAPS